MLQGRTRGCYCKQHHMNDTSIVHSFPLLLNHDSSKTDRLRTPVLGPRPREGHEREPFGRRLVGLLKLMVSVLSHEPRVSFASTLDIPGSGFIRHSSSRCGSWPRPLRGSNPLRPRRGSRVRAHTHTTWSSQGSVSRLSTIALPKLYLLHGCTRVLLVTNRRVKKPKDASKDQKPKQSICRQKAQCGPQQRRKHKSPFVVGMRTKAAFQTGASSPPASGFRV